MRLRDQSGGSGGKGGVPSKGNDPEGFVWRHESFSKKDSAPSGGDGHANESRESEPLRVAGGLIMIVDDDPQIHQVVRLVLPRKYEVVSVTDGGVFLDMAESYHPDLIIMDVHLAGHNGFDLCKRLRKRPGHRSIPVLFLTVLREDEGFLKLLEADGDAYLTKPFRTKTLIGTIRRLIHFAS